MAADDSTKIVISLETVLRNLNRTLRGLDQIKKRLDSIATVKVGTQSTASTSRAAAAAQKLAQQQQKLSVQTQELNNRQERARQTTERLALSQRRLEQSQQRVAQAVRGLNVQQDRHVQVFRAMERASQSFNRTLGSLGNSLRSVGQGLASFGATLTFSVTAPLVALGASITNAAVRLDSLKRGLTTIAGSSQEAAEQFQRLTQLAKLPGIGFEEAIQGSIRLQAVGFSAAEAEQALRQFSNAVALTGGGREQLENITVQLGQMAAQSKVLAQDLKPIISSAPAVAVALREAFGTVRSEELQELGIQSKEFIGILVSQLERLPRAAAGARNSFENFRDELFRAAATVGTVLLPALTRLVEVAGPVVTTLANAFAALPAPLQVIVVGFTALLAIAGPVAFIVGQLVLGVGRLLTGFIQLNTQGILPTIASMRALAASTSAALAAQRGLVVTTAAATGGLSLLLGAVGAVAAGFALYKAFQKDSLTLTKEQVNALDDQVKGLKEQVKFINSLSTGVERTVDQQQRLLEIYEGLNTQAKIRITNITDEEKRLVALRVELEKIIQLREREREQQTAALAAQLAGTLQQIDANEKSRQSIAARVQANTELANSIEREGKITAETARILEQRGISVAQVEAATFALRKESENLIDKQSDLITKHGELNGTAKEQAEVLRALGVRTEEQARQILAVAANLGLFKGRIDDTIPALRRYIDFTDQATAATRRFNLEQTTREKEIEELGKRGDEAQKKRLTTIRAFASLARETSVNFAGATKSFRQMVDAVPELAAALKRESELTGKALNELLAEALDDAFKGRKKADSTGLRNAQEQLQRALVDAAQASAEEQGEIERAKNDRLLQENENLFRLGLRAYRQYLSERARLTNANIQLEINAQRALADAAADERDRLIKRSQQGGIPPAESTRVRAQAAAADAQRIAAENRIINLRAQQQRLTDEVEQSLSEAQKQQFEDVRKLEAEYGELRGRIEDALNAATDEKFRESLQALSVAQNDLNQRLELAKQIGDRAAQAEITQAQALNQRQIDAIEAIVTQERALNRLAAANELVSRAKEKQSELERQIAFDVEFRGLSEEQAIARRLAGERRLADSLRVVRDLIQEQINLLNAQGVPVPQALLDFIRETRAAIQGLGELSFTEQFRLAEKEFNRINDERIRKIQDVERAVRNRTIAEVEGQIAIRRINGEYVGDLERQLALLQAIADKSDQDELRQRTADIGETVKDAKEEMADFNRQLRSVSIDALQDSLGQLFKDLADNTENALQDLLNFFNRIRQAVFDLIAENFAKEIVESLFPDPKKQKEGGIVGFFKRIFGIGGDPATKANTTATEQNTAALNALTTTFGGQAPIASNNPLSTATNIAGKLGVPLPTAPEGPGLLGELLTAIKSIRDNVEQIVVLMGGTPAGAFGAASGFLSQLLGNNAEIASGRLSTEQDFASFFGSTQQSFLSRITGSLQRLFGGIASSIGSVFSRIGSLVGGLFGFAEGDILPAKSGGRIIRVAEGGYPEAVLTTDPKHAPRQVSILRELMERTRGFYGRVAIPEFASGGIVSRETAEANLLSSINRAPQFSPSLPASAMETAAAQSLMNLRITNQVNGQALVEPYLSSEAGVRHIKNIISANSNEIIRRLRG